ncbi:hypothetical protein JAAARDRAFT_56287 [Jaapia argillacea MUCL 33604]|uniref:Uncharacterized protein n=1 Tax=Jaapia argillacea MUCL 33604 TaxID=933084 RepID=A0A067Q077_9AGAM|nr:hypothetical protein JAAARDRAFT_56287 [Jaapia argillacea MUCL 33604]
MEDVMLPFLSSNVEDVEETGHTLLGLIISAANDPQPRQSLSEIYHVIVHSGLSRFLDPLSVVPTLLPSVRLGSQDILDVIGECCSAKENVIAIQEALECLSTRYTDHEEEDEDEGHQGDESDNEETTTAAGQLIRLLNLSASSIPRLRITSKTKHSTSLHPLIINLQAVILKIPASKAESRVAISSVSRLVNGSIGWVRNSVVGVDEAELQNVMGILTSFLFASLTSCSNHIQSNLAQRTFERYFPRLVVPRSRPIPTTSKLDDWQEGEAVVVEALDAYTSVGCNLDTLLSEPSLGSLILFAHSSSPADPAEVIVRYLPAFLTSIQTNTALDESLSLLLSSVYQIHLTSSTAATSSPSGTSLETSGTSNELSTVPITTLLPLLHILPHLASAHPSPQIRHITYRLLSLLLSICPSEVRFDLLVDLVRGDDEEERGQIKVAAIGLVKEAVLDGLALSPGTSPTNSFTTPTFCKTFTPIIFTPSPSTLFTSDLLLEDFLDSVEPKRLIEALGLVFVLLMRDKDNRTGIRDASTVQHVKKQLLVPLKQALGRWLPVAEDDMEAIMPLAALDAAVERVEGALEKMDAELASQ